MRFLSLLLDIIFPLGRDALIVRSLTEIEVLRHMQPEPRMFDGIEAVALLPYRTREIGALIREAKFKSNAHAYDLLAEVLHEYLADYLADRNVYEERTTVLVPIPLSKKRYRERGYNQVEEVVKRVDLPSIEIQPYLLKRTRDTKAQTSLSRQERLRNTTDAFVSAPLNPQYLYIVVDDVSTTGATLTDAVRALQGAGAKHLIAITLTH